MTKQTKAESDALLEVGRRVRYWRKRRDLSQERLAQLADLDRTYIPTVEQAGPNMELGTLLRLAQALEVNAAELVRGLGLR